MMSPDYFDTMHKRAVKISTANIGWDPSVVVNQILRRLKEQRMPPEVVVGIDVRCLLVLFLILPAWVGDLLAPFLLPVPAAMKSSKDGSMHVDIKKVDYTPYAMLSRH
jgi:hypothetical protein